MFACAAEHPILKVTQPIAPSIPIANRIACVSRLVPPVPLRPSSIRASGRTHERGTRTLLGLPHPYSSLSTHTHLALDPELEPRPERRTFTSDVDGSRLSGPCRSCHVRVASLRPDPRLAAASLYCIAQSRNSGDVGLAQAQAPRLSPSPI
ncbi:hypothetical protein OH77DRAFT_1423012 [Trametes cingulata]|nr:hypothetical protein OH77DRAFT_1423012 [Trametes cingulata]